MQNSDTYAARTIWLPSGDMDRLVTGCSRRTARDWLNVDRLSAVEEVDVMDETLRCLAVVLAAVEVPSAADGVVNDMLRVWSVKLDGMYNVKSVTGVTAAPL